MFRIVVIVFTFLATNVYAGFHVAFEKGFDEYAQSQGFQDFDDFLIKRDACAKLIISSEVGSQKKQKNKSKLLKVSPPEGYHWMLEDEIFSLMKNPGGGYVKHPNSSLSAQIPIFPNFLPNSEVLREVISNDRSVSSLEVDPPNGFHWMNNGASYSLMKNPASGYGPHKGSSLKANFKFYGVETNKDVNRAIDGAYASTGEDTARKASDMLFDIWEKENKTSMGELFSNLDKKSWNDHNCGLRMFVEANMLTDLLEVDLTGTKIKTSKIKKPKAKNDYGYGY